MVVKKLFTSYLCNQEDELVQIILNKWKKLNPDFDILYFSDEDIKKFFENSEYNNSYKKLKNGVAIADFFRICYINKEGGYWFDIDLEPFKVNIPNEGNIHLFDCGFENISYMFIGGESNQLYTDVIDQVIININNNYKEKKDHIISITGPFVIQDIICNKLGIERKNGNLPGNLKSEKFLVNTPYQFMYTAIKVTNVKTDIYKRLQNKYNKLDYQKYDFI